MTTGEAERQRDERRRVAGALHRSASFSSLQSLQFAARTPSAASSEAWGLRVEGGEPEVPSRRQRHDQQQQHGPADAAMIQQRLQALMAEQMRQRQSWRTKRASRAGAVQHSEAEAELARRLLAQHHGDKQKAEAAEHRGASRGLGLS